MLIANIVHSELRAILLVMGLILIISIFLKRIKQPYILAYIISGIILGPFGLQWVTEFEVAEGLGELGLIILMFFIGMEISLKDFLKGWKVALFGASMQVVFSLLIVMLVGIWFEWSPTRIILTGFVISISSSAVVIKLLEDEGLDKLKIGQNIVTILVSQDIIVIPMIILMSFLGSGEVDYSQIILQVIGGTVIITIIVLLLKKGRIRLPFSKYIENDHELQVFASLIICFGLSFFTSSFELSAGLGAFVAGLLVHASPSTKWVHDVLHPFRIVLISVFFLSVGMLIDLDFLVKNIVIISILVVAVFVSNHGINAIILKWLGNNWRNSIYGGALLAQVGEFSFILASLGNQFTILTSYGYQLTIIVISLTIFLSPMWALLTKKISFPSKMTPG